MSARIQAFRRLAGWPNPHRYRILLVADDAPIKEIATAPDAAGLGVALVTLHEDAQAIGEHLWTDGRVGVQDGLTGQWIVHPWPRTP